MAASSVMTSGCSDTAPPFAYVAKPPEDTGDVALASSSGGEATAIDDATAISLDKLGPMTYVVTNIFTLERHQLSPGEWSVELDEISGRGAVYRVTSDPGDDDVVLLDDLFKRVVFVSSKGEQFVQTTATGHIQSLWSAKSRHSSGAIVVRSGASSGTYGLSCYVFHHARCCNQRVYWDLPQLYGIFRLTSFGGQRSVWLAKGRPRWELFIERASGFPMTIHSSHGNSKQNESSLASVDQCLPVTCASTFGLLLILARWAFASKQVGGMDNDVTRTACCELFEAFVFTFTSRPEILTLKIELVDSWKCRWPRPQPHEAVVVDISVDVAGNLDFSGLHMIATGRAKGNVAAAWWKQINAALKTKLPLSVPLSEFLRTCSHSVLLSSLTTQILWRVSISLEKIFAQQTKSSTATDPTVMMHMQWKDLADTFGEQLDSHIAEYTLRAAEATHNTCCISLLPCQCSRT